MPTITINVEEEPEGKEESDEHSLMCPRCEGEVIPSGSKKMLCKDCGRAWPKAEYEALTADNNEPEESDGSEGDAE